MEPSKLPPKRCAVCDPPPSYTAQEGQGSESILRSREESRAACERRCAVAAGCRAFTWSGDEAGLLDDSDDNCELWADASESPGRRSRRGGGGL